VQQYITRLDLYVAWWCTIAVNYQLYHIAFRLAIKRLSI